MIDFVTFADEDSLDGLWLELYEVQLGYLAFEDADCEEDDEIRRAFASRHQELVSQLFGHFDEV